MQPTERLQHHAYVAIYHTWKMYSEHQHSDRPLDEEGKQHLHEHMRRDNLYNGDRIVILFSDTICKHYTTLAEM